MLGQLFLAVALSSGGNIECVPGYHCWHRGSLEYLTVQGGHDETCCFCGKSKYVSNEPWGSDRKNHGRHVLTLIGNGATNLDYGTLIITDDDAFGTGIIELVPSDK